MSTITLRSTKGAPLTNAEVDNNFSNLNSDKLEVTTWEASTAFGITGTQVTNWDTAYGWGNHASAGYLTSETNTSLEISGNILTYTDELGVETDIDLSLYLDDTNLARLTSGSIDGNGLATFTRDDATTFTVDFSSLFDDTNLARITSASFNTGNGVLTLTRDDASTVTTDLDGRYLTSFTETDPTVPSHVKSISTTNIANWNTAYGWGDHSTEGYLTSFTESDPTVPSHVKSITSTNISNWNTAYGWGDHAVAGYLQPNTPITITGLHVDSTGAVELPTGTTAQRPTPTAGMFRFNSEEGEFEGYDGTEWGAIAGGGELSFVTTTFTATAGQTTFTVDYTVGAVIVYLNGVQLVPVTDYTATNGTSIVLTAGASLDDILVVQAFNTFEVANAITQAQADSLYATTTQGALADTAVQTNYTNTATSKTLAVNEKCLVTTSGQTITLPASPSEDDVVGVIVENFTDTVVARNGSTIMELAEDLTLDKEYLSLDLVYQSGSWRFV